MQYVVLTITITIHVGVLDYLHEANPNIWIYAMDKESKPVPRFYPHTFELRANRILVRQLRMTRH